MSGRATPDPRDARIAELDHLLEEAADVCPKKVAGTAREILKLKNALWTFVYTEGASPPITS